MHWHKLKYKPEGKKNGPQKNWREKNANGGERPFVWVMPPPPSPPPSPLRSPHIPLRRWQSSAICPRHRVHSPPGRELWLCCGSLMIDIRSGSELRCHPRQAGRQGGITGSNTATRQPHGARGCRQPGSGSAGTMEGPEAAPRKGERSPAVAPAPHIPGDGRFPPPENPLPPG